MRFELPLQTLELGIWQNICSIGRRENTWSFHQVLKAWTARPWWSVDLANSWVSGIFSNIRDSRNPLRNDWFYLADRWLFELFLESFLGPYFFQKQGHLNQEKRERYQNRDWYMIFSPSSYEWTYNPYLHGIGPPSRPVEDQRVPLRCKSLHCNHCLSTAVDPLRTMGIHQWSLLMPKSVSKKLVLTQLSYKSWWLLLLGSTGLNGF